MVLAAAWMAWGQEVSTAPGQVALDKEYTDTSNGFTLCPPANAQRVRESSNRRLVAWNCLDEKSGAICWSLNVLRMVHQPSTQPVREYAKEVAAELDKTGVIKSPEISINTVAERPAMHFRGSSELNLRTWKRQAWIELSPREHLVVSVSGSPVYQADMEAVMNAVLPTLKLFDPAKALADRLELLDKGSAVLSKLDEKTLRSVISPETYYLSLEVDGKPAGCIRISETIANRLNARGLEVLRLGVFKSGQKLRLTRDELFATPDQSLEHCRYVVQDSDGPRTTNNVQEVMKQEELFVSQQVAPAGRANTRPAPRQRELPGDLRVSKTGEKRQVYLPAALDVLLPRLLGRTAGAGYGFATYNVAANDFDLRAVKVLGQENISVGGKKVQAVHLQDQPALDAPLIDMWVDAEGRLLRLQTPEKAVLERSTREKMMMLYGSELSELDKMEAR